MKDSQRIGNVLSEARYKAGKSQEYMALELGVSKNTIVNWEKGTSSPKISQFFEWFNVLGINQHKPLMNLLYPDLYKLQRNEINNEKIINAVKDYMDSSSLDTVREMYYIILGDHGSDPIAFLNLMTAYLHLPMYYRISIARSIMDDFDICKYRNQLVGVDGIMPDVDMVKSAIESGKQAAMDGLTGYAKTYKGDIDVN